MIAIVDYGVGNVGSIANMLQRLHVENAVVSVPEELRKADKIILPGVGSFDWAMQSLQESGFVPELNSLVLEEQVPILGICLGMQLLGKGSEEGKLAGLGWLDAEAVRFEIGTEAGLRVPHMGFNTLEPAKDHPVLRDVPELRFYFVHSYHMRCNRDEDVLARTHYGDWFVSAVSRENILGAQFHPEKSHNNGKSLFKAFSEL